MDSVIQHTKECFICRATQGLESHHIYYGTDNRHTSEKYGMKVWLCKEHHTGANGIHRNPNMDAELKEYGQMIFERKFPEENFRERFGRSYL